MIKPVVSRRIKNKKKILCFVLSLRILIEKFLIRNEISFDNYFKKRF